MVLQNDAVKEQQQITIFIVWSFTSHKLDHLHP